MSSMRMRLALLILGLGLLLLALLALRYRSAESTTNAEKTSSSGPAVPPPLKPREPDKAASERASTASTSLKPMPRITASQVREIIHRILATNATAVISPQPNFSTFGRDAALHRIEGRLLALAFPQETEQAAFEIAFDPNRTMLDRDLGVRLLGFLAISGRASSKQALARLAADGNGIIRELAVDELYPSDLGDAYRPVFVEQCYAGNRAAFRAMSLLADPSTVKLMSDLKDGKGSGAETRSMAVDA